MNAEIFDPTYFDCNRFCRFPKRPIIAGDMAILGVPYDGGVSNRPGARGGPMAIRRASLMFDADRDPVWPRGTYVHGVDAGDVEFSRLEERASEIIEAGGHLITLGGDHSITLPLLRAHAKKYGQLALIHFDAHPDLWPVKNGVPDHGSFLTQALDEGLVDPFGILQIGIRTITPYQPGFSPATSLDAFCPSKKCYLTFDIDVLDPAFAPGTGTPVPGGLSTKKALKLISKIFDWAGLEVVGMDLVEVSPVYDVSETTSLAAASVILRYIQDVQFYQNVRKASGSFVSEKTA